MMKDPVRTVAVSYKSLSLLGLIALLAAFVQPWRQQQFQMPPAEVKPEIGAAYGSLPLNFEANHGQTDASVDFLARGAGYTIFLKPSEAVFVLSRRESAPTRDLADPAAAQAMGIDGESVRDPTPAGGSRVLRMKLVGGTGSATVKGEGPSAGKVNYFTGSDPSKWRTTVSLYERVSYHEVYPGIDLVYYGNQRQLEYDFVVAPGSDPNLIRLSFDGADNVETDLAGDLVLTLGDAVIRQPKPIIYQNLAGERRPVAGGYSVDTDGQVGFRLGEYDRAEPLVIDPIVFYSTYLGGSGEDAVRDVAVDAAGNLYMCGNTTSTNFPTTTGAFDVTYNTGNTEFDGDAFVVKFNPTGTSLIYSTYLGGTGNSVNLSGDDTCTGIAIDSGGNAYLAGETRSTNFPMQNAHDSTFGGLFEGYLTKLDPEGDALVYSTFIGGDAFDSASSVAVDASGQIYVAGRTTSSGFATVGAYQTTFAGGGSDAFVRKYDASGSTLIYSTYLGGGGGSPDNNGFDAAFGLAIDSAGHAYITGPTLSDNFPTESPIQATYGGGTTGGDGFVTKINPAGTGLVYSTYLGSSANDLPQHIAVDSSGAAYVTGSTESNNFTLVNAYDSTFGGTSEAFVTKFTPTGSAHVYSTYVGGSGTDGGNDIRVDSAGNAYVGGFTSSTDFPTLNATQGSNGGGSNDGFVLKLNAAGSALAVLSTYLGGTGADSVFALAVDPAGRIYVAGITTSTDFPTRNPMQPANGGGSDDAFVAKIGETATAGGVSVSGRVYGDGGRGLRNAAVTIVDQKGVARTVLTSSRGYFFFDDVPAGRTYIVSVAARQHSYSPKVVELGDSVTDLEFLAGR